LSLLPLTAPEVRRLLLALREPPDRFGFHLQWSRWRRRHQAVAKRCHTWRRAQRYAAVPQEQDERGRSSAAGRETAPVMLVTNLTEAQWQDLAPLLPRPRQRQGRPAHDVRQMVQAMLWVEQTGCSWRSLPARFGSWQDVYALYHRWRQSGLWLRIRQALQPPSLEAAAA
jgi:hypothetical protein